MEWAEKKLPRFWWGRGLKHGSCIPTLVHKGVQYYPFALWTYGRVEIQFQALKNRKPFDDGAKRKELTARLNKIPGVDISSDAIAARPAFDLSLLADERSLEEFFNALDWFLQQIETG